ncbi:hypothetical protein SmJEL517_g02029 [Synchytrium microbalum]|uniref:Ribosomal protein/NADH dehydrogenase domain-containing protein n=1 Tax=Synchytrium microbalum TaxID=1806994 RepID=A0A507C1Z1_9FUNG|nr:uncharacterized protein SmJEL517_g02029 [Synchytrium microbalum]TPX35540.1 hypothetical protein SmJEL517_g02029 [Synchytrium microbalum]
MQSRARPLLTGFPLPRTFLDSLYACKENPKCIINVNLDDKVKVPTIQLVYRDKKQISIDSSTLSAAEIVKDIRTHSRKLQMAEDISAS